MTPTTLICALVVTFYAVRILLRRIFSDLDNIPGPPRKSILAGVIFRQYKHYDYNSFGTFAAGSLSQFYDPDDWAFQHDLEENYAQVVKIHGILGDRQLFVFDPAALHSVLVQDQDNYETPAILDRLLFGKGILSTALEEHRKYRKVMMPAFSTANLRGVVPLFYEVAQRTRDGLIAPDVMAGPKTLDLNSILCRTSLELIGKTGIDYSFDPMLPVLKPSKCNSQSLSCLFSYESFPPSFLRFMIGLIPYRNLQELRDIVDLTDGTATDLVRDRKAAIESGKLDINDGGKDIMSLLAKSNASAASEMRLTDEELVACTSMILFAATDTTSSSMNRLFHVLASYPDVQEKLRAEIIAAPEHLDHDALIALPYLDGVVREILRLYPPAAPVMFREAMADAVLPLSTPITGVDGKLITSITVPKGTTMYIAIAAANHNRRIWGEDALEFRPERWINGKAESVTTKMCGIYGNTMTFIGGGRSCIGFKFAQLEMKVVACVLLRTFKFSSPDARIKWRKAGIIPAPNVGNEPALPILVERLNA
ncbi:Cytochrome P450 [Mycena venus]|uniref:Cytochrome P450 n=1 Tax=Mycena venus TaxID=2733690 RepID=A0A8H6YR45_9AGAR|nr:Cytochrome P450 [Mycena venus]